MRNACIPLLALGSLFVVATSSAADPVVITGGSPGVFLQIDLPTFTICTGRCDPSADSVFNGVLASNAGQLFNAGDVVVPEGGGVINAAGPVTEIINGISYQAFLSGSFAVTPTPFVAPPQTGAPTFSFTTPFTMQGQIAGSFDPMHQMPIFSFDVTGSGIETVSGRTFANGNPADYFATSFISQFEPPASTPEPATVVLVGCALLSWCVYLLRAHVS